jgi:RND family efflux transporter MFP subunit
MRRHVSRPGFCVFLLMVGVALSWTLGCSSESAYVEPPPPTVTVALPVSQTVTDYLEVTGSVEATERVEVRARVEGFLQKIEFREGDYVEEGQLLYVIDPREYKATHEQAVASLHTAEASFKLQSATLQRRERAARTGAVSELEVLESRAKRDVAVARVQAAEAEVRRAQLDLGYTTIHSPISGRIGDSAVDPGNLVGAGEKTLLTTIVTYDPIHVYFTINERALLRLSAAREGDVAVEDDHRVIDGATVEAARVTDEGYPFVGALDLADQGVDRETGTMMLRAIFDNPDPVRLVPGLFVRGRLPLRERDNVLLVSERALGADQTGRYLLVVDENDVVQYRSVEVGTLIDGMRVIDKGVAAEDRVITKGILYARPGGKVVAELEGPGSES